MTVFIKLDDGQSGELEALLSWLKGVDELRGCVERAAAKPGRDEMGVWSDSISVVLGPGGTGVAFASALAVWLRSRASVVKLKVRGGERVIDLDVRGKAATDERVLEVLQPVLSQGGPSDGAP